MRVTAAWGLQPFEGGATDRVAAQAKEQAATWTATTPTHNSAVQHTHTVLLHNLWVIRYMYRLAIQLLAHTHTHLSETARGRSPARLPPPTREPRRRRCTCPHCCQPLAAACGSNTCGAAAPVCREEHRTHARGQGGGGYQAVLALSLACWGVLCCNQPFNIYKHIACLCTFRQCAHTEA